MTTDLPSDLRIACQAGLGVTRPAAAPHLHSACMAPAQTLPCAVAKVRRTGQTGPSVLDSLSVIAADATELRLGLEQSFQNVPRWMDVRHPLCRPIQRLPLQMRSDGKAYSI